MWSTNVRFCILGAANQSAVLPSSTLPGLIRVWDLAKSKDTVQVTESGFIPNCLLYLLVLQVFPGLHICPCTLQLHHLTNTSFYWSTLCICSTSSPGVHMKRAPFFPSARLPSPLGIDAPQHFSTACIKRLAALPGTYKTLPMPGVPPMIRPSSSTTQYLQVSHLYSGKNAFCSNSH